MRWDQGCDLVWIEPVEAWSIEGGRVSILPHTDGVLGPSVLKTNPKGELTSGCSFMSLLGSVFFIEDGEIKPWKFRVLAGTRTGAH